MTSTALYRSLMEVIERRRLELGLSMERVNDLAGTQDGYYAKMIYPDTPSGRQARWETVDLVVEALFGKDFVLQIEGENPGLRSAPRIDRGISEKSLQVRHWRHRTHFKTLGEIGRAKRFGKMTKDQRSELGRKLVRKRWRAYRKAKRVGDKHRAENVE